MKRRYPDRKYPYIIERKECLNVNRECEACGYLAKYLIKYEPDESILDLMPVFLCIKHDKLARAGEWRKVFKDIDAKIEERFINET